MGDDIKEHMWSAPEHGSPNNHSRVVEAPATMCLDLSPMSRSLEHHRCLLMYETLI